MKSKNSYAMNVAYVHLKEEQVISTQPILNANKARDLHFASYPGSRVWINYR